MSSITPATPRFGTLNFQVINPLPDSQEYHYRVSITIDDSKPDDYVSINGEHLGKSSIAQGLTTSLREGMLTVQLFRQQAIKLLSDKSLLNTPNVNPQGTSAIFKALFDTHQSALIEALTRLKNGGEVKYNMEEGIKSPFMNIGEKTTINTQECLSELQGELSEPEKKIIQSSDGESSWEEF